MKKRGKNVSNLLDGNLHLLLDLLRANEGMTRQDLVDATVLSPSGISKLVSFLIEKGLVVEDGIVTRIKGRRAISLKLNDSTYYSIGIRLARNYIRCGLFNLKGQLVYHIQSKLASKKLSETTDVLVSLVTETLAEVERQKLTVYGVGISAPGPLSSSEGRLILTSSYPEWSGFSVKTFIEEYFGFASVIVEHDANVSVLAEKWFGKGQECNDLVYVVADRGVGAGIYSDGIYTGYRNVAGEIGHTTIDYNGRKCECGNRGCLEMYCSSTAVLKEAQSIFESEGPEGWKNDMTIEEIGHLASRSEPNAKRLLTKAGTFLGIGLVNIINTYNPEMIIIGGEMAKAGDVWFNAVKAAVEKRSPSEIHSGTFIDISSLPMEPAFLGTGILAINQLFESASSFVPVDKAIVAN